MSEDRVTRNEVEAAKAVIASFGMVAQLAHEVIMTFFIEQLQDLHRTTAANYLARDIRDAENEALIRDLRSQVAYLEGKLRTRVEVERNVAAS